MEPTLILHNAVHVVKYWVAWVPHKPVVELDKRKMGKG